MQSVKRCSREHKREQRAYKHTYMRVIVVVICLAQPHPPPPRAPQRILTHVRRRHMPHGAEYRVEPTRRGKPRGCEHASRGHLIGSDVESSTHSSPVKDPAGALKVAESGAEEAMHGGPAKPGCASPETDNSEIIADHARLACAGPNFGQEAEGSVAPPKPRRPGHVRPQVG